MRIWAVYTVASVLSCNGELARLWANQSCLKLSARGETRTKDVWCFDGVKTDGLIEKAITALKP